MFISLILSITLFQTGTSNVSIIKNVETTLEKVLNFMDEHIEQFGFDGFFGLALAQTQLIETLEQPLGFSSYRDVMYFISRCENILTKATYFLPMHPAYMVIFKNKLLNSQNWLRVLPKSITVGEIPNLGMYENWSPEMILKNRGAIYRGVETNVCLREILELSDNKTCYISSICQEMMLKMSRIDTGYLLTHRLLYMQITRLQGCTIPRVSITTKEYIRLFCSYILKEAKTNEHLHFPYHDIFLEQVVLCGMEGFSEFLNEEWLKAILEWQNSHGCYESIPKTTKIQNKIVQKRTSQIIDYGCSDHTTGLGAAALALYLKNLNFIV